MTEVGNTIIKVCGIYELLLIIIGTIFNFVTFAICWRKELRKRATFVFMAFTVLLDTGALYFWNLNHFTLPFFNFVLESYGLVACKLVTVFQCTFLQSAAWLLVTMNVERCLFVIIKGFKLSTMKATIIASCIPIFLFAINANLFVTLEYEQPLNRSNYDLCYESSMYVTWRLAHMLLYSLIPWFLIVVANLILIYKILSKKFNKIHTVNSHTNRQKMSLSLVVMTIFFIVCTLPGSVIGTFFLSTVMQNSDGLAILFVFDSLKFSCHSFNFIVFITTNKKFVLELKSALSINTNGPIKITRTVQSVTVSS